MCPERRWLDGFAGATTITTATCGKLWNQRALIRKASLNPKNNYREILLNVRFAEKRLYRHRSSLLRIVGERQIPFPNIFFLGHVGGTFEADHLSTYGEIRSGGSVGRISIHH